MRRLHEGIGSGPERGGASIFVVAFTALFIAGALMFSSQHVRSRYKSVSMGSIGQSLLMNILGRVRLGLTAQSSCSKLDLDLRAFRNFSAAAPVYTLTRSGSPVSAPCLLTDEEAKNVSHLQLEVTDVGNDPNALAKTLRVFVKLMIADPAGKNPPRPVSISSGFRLRVASLDQFNVILIGSQTPLIRSSGPKLHFTGPIFHSATAAVPINQTYSPTGTDKITFHETFFVRNRSLSAGTKNVDTASLKTVFTKGIETDVLNSPTLNAFLPNGGPAWKHGFDYAYVNNKTGYALPESQAGTMSLDCSAGTAYNAARGNLQNIPANGTLAKASLSCAAESLMIPVVQFMNQTANLNLTLTTGDNVFCGLIVANQLQINLQRPGKYAIFGQFIASSISVTGNAQAELYVYSPYANGQIEVELPGGISMFRNQVKTLASSTAHNLFLPIAAASPYRPRRPDEYLASCGNGFMRPQTSYPPLDADPLFNNLRFESARPLYTVEGSL